jgi:hypothetical protein
MQKKIQLLAILLAILSVLTAGCATYEIAKDFNKQKIETTDATPIASIHADNFGYYLFNSIPLITGDTKNVNSFCVFKNTVTVKPVIAMLTEKAKELGATRTTNIKTNVEQTGVIGLWIFWYRGVQASGNAVK